jgi:hypothetical protein
MKYRSLFSLKLVKGNLCVSLRAIRKLQIFQASYISGRRESQSTFSATHLQGHRRGADNIPGDLRSSTDLSRGFIRGQGPLTAREIAERMLAAQDVQTDPSGDPWPYGKRPVVPTEPRRQNRQSTRRRLTGTVALKGLSGGFAQFGHEVLVWGIHAVRSNPLQLNETRPLIPSPQLCIFFSTFRL